MASEIEIDEKLDMILKSIRDLTDAVRTLHVAYEKGVIMPTTLMSGEVKKMLKGMVSKDELKDVVKGLAPILEEYQQNVVTRRLLRREWKSGEFIKWVIKKWEAAKHE